VSEGERERVSDFNYCGPKIGEADSTGLTGPAKFYPVVFCHIDLKLMAMLILILGDQHLGVTLLYINNTLIEI